MYINSGIVAGSNNISNNIMYIFSASWSIGVYVDDDGGKDYTSIQNAINGANEGDTIYVYNGTYDENIVVNKTINLIGASNEKTIINYDKNRYGQVNIILITANNCTIKGFKLINTISSSVIMGINVKS